MPDQSISSGAESGRRDERMMQALLLICLRDNGKEKGTLWPAALSQCRHRHHCVRKTKKKTVYKKKSLLSALHQGRFTWRSHCFVDSLSFTFFVMFWVWISLFLFYNLGVLIVGHVLIYLLSLVFLVWCEFMSFWVFDFSCHFMARLVRSFSFVI